MPIDPAPSVITTSAGRRAQARERGGNVAQSGDFETDADVARGSRWSSAAGSAPESDPHRAA
mgnify:CR=1 FL=1